METTDTVLVIRPVLRAGNHAFDHITVEVPRGTAEDQLSRIDAQRHSTWRGVRYATEEEKRAYYGIQEESLVVEKVEESQTTEPVAKAVAESKIIKTPKVK